MYVNFKKSLTDDICLRKKSTKTSLFLSFPSTSLPFLSWNRKKVKFFLGSIKKLKILKVGFKDYVSVSFEDMENS